MNSIMNSIMNSSKSCVFFHPTICASCAKDKDKEKDKDKDKENEKYKWVKNTPRIQHEMQITNKIKQIPQWETYFSVDTFTPITLSVRNIYIQDRANIMVTLNACTSTCSLKDFLEQSNNTQTYLHFLLDFYNQLLSSIILLTTHNIVHNNIQLTHLIVDQVNECILLDHFAMAMDTTNINTTNINTTNINGIYNPKQLECPFEHHFLSFMVSNKLNSLSMYNIEQIIDDVLLNHYLLSIFSGNIADSFKKDALQYYKKYFNQSYESIVKDMMQYSCTWDNYSLNIMYLRFFIGLHKQQEQKEQEQKKEMNPFILSLLKLFITNIHFHPAKRLSLKKTKETFQLIVSKVDLDDLKDFI